MFNLLDGDYKLILDSFSELRDKAFETKENSIQQALHSELHAAYPKDFNYLCMFFGRQTGATTWLINKAIEKSKNSKILFVSPNMMMLRHITPKLAGKENIIACSASFAHEAIVGVSVDYIFVDASELLGEVEKERIFQIPAKLYCFV